MAKNSGASAMGDYYSPESDLHHLTMAHQIRNNPKRHKAAKALAKQKMAAMAAAMKNDPEDNPKMGGDGGVDEMNEKD